MALEYMQKYTDIRTGKLSFNQFMEFTNEVFCLGYEKGTISAQAQPAKPTSCHPLANRQSSDATRIAYESVF